MPPGAEPDPWQAMTAESMIEAVLKNDVEMTDRRIEQLEKAKQTFYQEMNLKSMKEVEDDKQIAKEYFAI